MKQSYAWIPNQIKSYKALYKGRRFWAFENDFERPCEYYTDPRYHQVLLYDTDIGEIIAAGSWMEDGKIDGCVM